MKNPILFLLLFAAHGMLFSQKPVVKISPEFKLPKDIAFQDHLLSDESGHYVYYYEGGGGLFGGYSIDKVILEKFSPEFKSVMKKEYAVDEKGVVTFGMKYFQGKFAMLTSQNFKKEDYVQYGLVSIGLDGKKGPVTKLAKVKYESKDEIPSIRWGVSADSSKLMFLATVDDDDDERKTGIFASIIDNSYSPIWSRKYKLTQTEEQYYAMSTVVNTNGDVYIIAKAYEGKKAKESKKDKKKKSKPAYDIILYRLSKDNEEVQEFKLALGTSFIRSAALETSKTGELFCTGFFSNTKQGPLQGVFFLKLGPDGSILTQNKKEFSVQDLKMFGEKNTDEDKDDDVGLEDNFKFTDFLIGDDGSAVVVCEQYYTVTRSSYNAASRTWTYTTYYYNNDMVTFSISTTGNIERVAVIPKYQVSSNPYFQGYTAMVKDKSVVFFYNDDEDNMKKPVTNPKPKKISSFKDCIAVVTVLDEAGKLNRKQLFEAKDVESLFIPEDSKQINKNELFFVTKKHRMFGKTIFHVGTITMP